MSELVTEEILEAAVSRHWDLISDDAKEVLRKFGREPRRWPDIDPRRQAVERERFTGILRIAAPMIAARALEEAAAEVKRWRDEGDERAEFPDTRTFWHFLRSRANEHKEES
jgi:hypothetical protein